MSKNFFFIPTILFIVKEIYLLPFSTRLHFLYKFLNYFSHRDFENQKMQQVGKLVTLQDPSLQNIEVCFTLPRICHFKFEKDTLYPLGP